MSTNLNLAQRYALNLARSLMTCVVLFRGDGGYGVMAAAEYDGDLSLVIHEYDPFA